MTGVLDVQRACVVVRWLSSGNGKLGWVAEFAKGEYLIRSCLCCDADPVSSVRLQVPRRRFLTLISLKFKEFGSVTSLCVIGGMKTSKSDYPTHIPCTAYCYCIKNITRPKPPLGALGALT